MNRITKKNLQKKLKKLKNELQELRSGIEVGGLDESYSSSISELSLYDNHPGDIGTETFERGKDFALKESVNIRLEKIDEALEAIKKGTYGTCDICGKEIDIERLYAMPETTQCKKCREDEEKVLDRHLRPLEEDVIRPPYGDFNKEDIGFDGEDTWQKVAVWNEHAQESGAGAYYGGDTNLDEDGETEFIESIPYFQGADGIQYEDVYGMDDESAPTEKIVGKQYPDRLKH